MRSEIPSQRTNITTANSKQLEQYSNPKSSHQTTDTRSKSGGAQFSSRNSKRTKKKKKKKTTKPTRDLQPTSNMLFYSLFGPYGRRLIDSSHQKTPAKQIGKSETILTKKI